MEVVIAGGHGAIAMRLSRLLAGRDDPVRALIRNPDQAEDVQRTGAGPVVCDLEQADPGEIADAVGSADAVVFAAGAGPGSGPERKETMDYEGAVKLLSTARSNGIDRYVMVSAMAADPDAPGEDTFSVYLRAKGRADEKLRESGLAYTIVRPGKLTDQRGTGRVEIGESVERGEVSRDDVASVLAAVLHEPRTAGLTFELVSGETPVEQAVAEIAASV